jgi:hypothetical protein
MDASLYSWGRGTYETGSMSGVITGRGLEPITARPRANVMLTLQRSSTLSTSGLSGASCRGRQILGRKKGKTVCLPFCIPICALAFHLTPDRVKGRYKHAFFFDIGSCFRYRLHKAEPEQGQRVVKAMERNHCVLERSAWHCSHVDRAVQVPPGSPEIAFASKVCVNRTRVLHSGVGAPAA